MSKLESDNQAVIQVLDYIWEQYGVRPEFLWAHTPNHAAFRHNNHKWFGALLLDTPRKVLGLPNEGTLDILNLKCDPMLIGSLLDGKRYLPGYHMNKEHWITAVLDEDTDLSELIGLIDHSYELTGVKRRVKKPQQEEL